MLCGDVYGRVFLGDVFDYVSVLVLEMVVDEEDD